MDKNNNPLSYTESLASWTTQSTPNTGACLTGCSGAGLFLDDSFSSSVGYQVSGSLLVGGSNMDVEFTQNYANWINTESASYLAPVPLLSSMWLLGSAVVGLLSFYRRAQWI